MQPAGVKWGSSGFVEVSAWSPGVFRVRIGRGSKARRYPSYAITAPPEASRAVRCTGRGSQVVARAGGWTLRVTGGSSPKEFRLEVLSPGGESVFSTPRRGGALSHDRKQGWTLRFGLARGVQYYGLGEFGERIGRVPGRYRCWNMDDPAHQPLKQPYCCIPFMVSPGIEGDASHAVFVDNPGQVTFDLGMAEQRTGRITAQTGDLDLWLFGAPTPADLLALWTQLTGRTERPPLWSLGYHQSRYSYMSADEVRRVAGQLRTRHIPAGVIHLDIDYMDGCRVFTWNPKTFARPERLVRDLASRHFRAVTIVDPGIKVDPGYEPYKEGMRKGYFVCGPDGKPIVSQVWPGSTHHPDFTNPAVREWWGKEIEKSLLEKGVAGIWCDMNEPALWDEIGFGIRFLKDFRHDGVHFDEGAGRSHREIHNIYGLLMARAVYEGLRRSRPNERAFVLARAGWAGSQRYGAIWTGDDRSSHWAIPLDLTGILSLSACGVPFTGCDIGGFLNDSHSELFVRWMELGVFLPFCRSHSAKGTARQEPWSFGPEAEEAVRRLIRIRMELLPYLYTAFVESSETGMPVARPLWLVYPTDKNCREIGDQFLLGNDILVAPVFHPGLENRAVYLPDGEWYPLGGCERVAGGRWVAERLPEGWPPAFVRAGAVIPRAEGWDGTASERPAELVLDIYPGRGALEGAIAEDDGISMGYLSGVESRRTVSGGVSSRSLALALRSESPGSGFAASPVTRLYWHSGDLQATSLRLNGARIAGRWDADTPLLLPHDTETFSVSASLHSIKAARRRCLSRNRR